MTETTERVQIRPGAKIVFALPEDWNPALTDWRLVELNGRAVLIFCNPHHPPLIVTIDDGPASVRT